MYKFSMEQKTLNNRGFTLIELIIVFAILGMMAAAVIAVLNPFAQFQKANDARRKADLSQIQKALESYYQDNGKYPDNASASDYRIMNESGAIINWGGSWQPYMNILPKDPTTGYTYLFVSNGQTYYLYASLERGNKDPQVCNSGNRCTNAPVNANCGGTCNYGVASADVNP